MSLSNKSFKIGASSTLSKTITEKDIILFSEITGDINPLHLNEEYAAKTIFKKKIAHGFLTAGLISAVIGTKLPGPGTIYLSQNLEFRAPVNIGSTITAKVTILDIYKEGKRMKLKTQVHNELGKIVLDGEALVIPPRRARARNWI